MIDWDPRALAVLLTLEEAGHQAVLVGGCVRDSLLGKAPHDYDAATSAHPDEIEAACSSFRCVETGLKHGTVTVLNQGLSVEVTSFRRESGYSDHRRPDQVIFTDSLREDLARRDFTINAIAWEHGGLSDPFGGREDLEHRMIRCVGDPDTRFTEDALRPLRGLRLAAQLNFSIEPATSEAIRRHIPDLSLVAWERISAEFIRLLCSPGAREILLDYPEAVVQIVPELKPAVGFDQKNYHHCYDVYTHIAHAVDLAPPKPALRLAALLHDVGKPSVFSQDETGLGHFYGHANAGVPLAQEALKRLRLPNALQEKVLTLVENHHIPVEASRRWARRWLSRLGEENLRDVLDLKRADVGASAPDWRDASLADEAEAMIDSVLAENACLTLKDLAVNGRDAMACGLSGPAIGQALNRLLERVVEGEIPNNRGMLIGLLKEGK